MNQSHLNAWIVISVLLNTLFHSQPIAAQVIPDTTLPPGERSQVTGNPDFQIDGGARRGGSLFHSFDQFSIPTGGSAFFNNAADVQNIFSRVTGGSASNIDGVIRANGRANLFLLNPNGILFGPNASLNIGGSFVGTTANAIGFPNGEVFSSDATQLLPNQLLTINPDALFFNQRTPQPIVNRSTFNDTGLQVSLRQNLLLVGGPVQLYSGRLISPGSYIEMGSVGGVGTIGLSTLDEDWHLNIPSGVTRADALLRNGGDINVRGDGGSIRILAQNIHILGSTLRIAIPSDSRSPATRTGDLELNAAGSITIRDSLLANSLFGAGTMGGTTLRAGDRITIREGDLYSTAEPGSRGDIGDVTITARTVLFDNTFLIANTSQPTDASAVFITARDTVSLDSSFVYSTVEQTGRGDGGDINITSRSIALTGRTGLFAEAYGQGNGGDVNIDARNTVSIDNSFIFNSVKQTGSGNGGDINITTGSLATREAQLFLFIQRQGNVGDLNIDARNTVSIDNSFIETYVDATAIGDGGDINITADSLSLNESSLTSNASGQGNAGNININARDTVSLSRNADLSTTSSGLGNTGTININAGNAISLDQGSVETRMAQFVSSGTNGDTNITTGTLSLTNGGRIYSTTLTAESAGNVNINARDAVVIDGAFQIDVGGQIPPVVFPSGIITRVNEEIAGQGEEGQGGDVSITTGSLFLTNGGSIDASTNGQGDAGLVTIRARDSIEIRGTVPNLADFRSGITTSTTQRSVGNGGEVFIEAGSLAVSDQGRISTNAQGQGRAGNIRIRASGAVSFDSGDAISNLDAGAVGRGGNIRIGAGSLSLRNGAQLSTTTSGRGDAGSVNINTRDRVSVDGESSNGAIGSAISTRVESSGVGQGGNIDVTTRSLSVLNSAQLSASTSGEGDAGNITVSADTMSLSRGGRLLTATFSRGQAGDITVNTPDLQLSGADSGLFAQTTTAADAGDLTIQPRDNGQSVRVNLEDGAQISASTSSSGRGGTLTITAPDSITLTGNGSVIAAETGGTGTGGNLFLTTGDLRIQDQAEVTVSSSAAGSAGSMFVEADRIFLDNGGRIRADTSGGGGDITLRSPLILLRNGSNITTNARGENIPGGNINIDTEFLVAVPNEDSNISANSQNFRGGNVRIEAIALYGIQPSFTSTPLSDITATGATSALPGTIDVTTGVIDPTSGLVALPTDLVDASGLIAQSCPADVGNSFVVTGRGGLPPTPAQELDDAAEWQDRSIITVAQQPNREGARNLTSETSAEASQPRVGSQATTATSTVEATGWQRTATGEVILVVDTSDPTTQNSLHQSAVCNGRG
jgi:filamentous hemagglutinin family protein